MYQIKAWSVKTLSSSKNIEVPLQYPSSVWTKGSSQKQWPRSISIAGGVAIAKLVSWNEFTGESYAFMPLCNLCALFDLSPTQLSNHTVSAACGVAKLVAWSLHALAPGDSSRNWNEHIILTPLKHASWNAIFLLKWSPFLGDMLIFGGSFFTTDLCHFAIYKHLLSCFTRPVHLRCTQAVAQKGQAVAIKKGPQTACWLTEMNIPF